ncbi:MAG TPA: CBS domain-containing protein [Thermoanaerobaculaceae bacterium]|nr:CBS domain-containing protein [Thermoanaerobaculaceae bacterium]
MHLRVKDFMTDRVVTATPQTTIDQVLKEMQVHGINGTVVVDDERHVLGVVTQGDVFRAALPTEAEVLADESYFLSAERLKEHIREALLRPVGEIMSRRLVSVSPDSPAALAGGIMLDHRIKQLPVVEAGILQGIITIADITRQFV